MKLMNKYRIPLLVMGPTGIGKTQIIDAELSSHKIEEYLVVKMNFSASTTSKEIQSNFMSKVDRKKRGTYGPKGIGQKGVWFIDDLNLPAPDAYDFQPPLELLRQFIENSGWYDMEELKMINIVDFALICSCAPPGGSKYPLPNRVMRHFYFYSSVENNSATLIRIFGKIAKWVSLKKDLNEEASRVLGFAVEASIDLFLSISESLKPTPSKPHYIFNLRDISKIFQGLYLVDNGEFAKGTNKICRAWIHETCRVLGDRITHQKDRDTLYMKMKSVINHQMRCQLDQVFVQILPEKHKFEDRYTEFDRVMFTDILGESPDVTEREYQEQTDMNMIRKKVELELEEYNVTRKDGMNISIFDFAVSQILKICRILRLDKSHGVLIGLGGSGRQTLTKLSSYIMGQQSVTVEVHKNYSFDKWRTDIKKILSDSVVTNKPSTLVITETQSNKLFLMQDIDNMLNLGEIPNLFETDEFLKFLDKLKEKAKKEGEDKLAQNGTIPE
jgi:dynein heavy chain